MMNMKYLENYQGYIVIIRIRSTLENYQPSFEIFDGARCLQKMIMPDMASLKNARDLALRTAKALVDTFRIS